MSINFVGEALTVAHMTTLFVYDSACAPFYGQSSD